MLVFVLVMVFGIACIRLFVFEAVLLVLGSAIMLVALVLVLVLELCWCWCRCW